MHESEERRQARRARVRAIVLGRRVSWRETIQRAWRSIKRVVLGRRRSRQSVHRPARSSAPERDLLLRRTAGSASHNDTSSPSKAWDWKQATRDLKRQRELEMLKAKRMGPSAASRRAELVRSCALPLTHAVSILTPHVDAGRPSGAGRVLEEICEAACEQDERDEDEARAATDAHVSTDAFIEVDVPEVELARITLDLPIMGLLVQR